MKRIFAIVMEGKGGCGKSFIAQLLCGTMIGADGQYLVRVIDSDVNNSSMAQIDSKAVFAGLRDANDLEASGTIAMAVRDLGEDLIQGVVWDTAAGIEDIIRVNVLPRIIVRAEKARVKLVVFRPITTSAFTQDAALEFASWAKERGIAVVFVRNLGQGRAAKYFAEWDQLPDRGAAIPPAVEIILPDLGSWVADEATALGLSLSDVALGKFGHLSEKARAVAERKFTPATQLAVADWLELRRIEFEEAITKAIANLSTAQASETASPASTKAKVK